jgi:DNA-binding MarR family transcriptional regulator
MKLGDALGLIHNFRQFSDMPMSQAYCLLLIATYEGLSLKELANRADIGMASASRHVAMFSSQGLKGVKGMGLVEALEDPMERRKKIIKLTPKGKQTVAKIIGEKNANL